MGVSATHLDWTMVPYVRKSFYKHYLTGSKYIMCGVDTAKLNDEMSIESETYKTCPQVYKYAMNETTRELKQAVEGLYHNLNTLQSRSGGL